MSGPFADAAVALSDAFDGALAETVVDITITRPGHAPEQTRGILTESVADEADGTARHRVLGEFVILQSDYAERPVVDSDIEAASRRWSVDSYEADPAGLTWVVSAIAA